MTAPRLVFAGDFHWRAGSSHMISEYARAASEVGCRVAVCTQLSRLDGVVDNHLPLVDDLSWGTHLVLVFEGRQFLDAPRRELVEQVPRCRRLVIDADGRWGLHLQLGADDSAGPLGHDAWQQLYQDLSDNILQPRLGPLPTGARFFSYFGMPEPVEVRGPRYDLQYVGANWWRWEQLTSLVEAARPSFSRLRVCGRWWDEDPHPEHLAATANEPGWLAARNVNVQGPVPFSQVVPSMAEAVLTPVLARPLLAAQRLLTPRMFETVAATGTIPVLPAALEYTRHLYGDDVVAAFSLGEHPAGDLARLHRDAAVHQRELAALRADLHRRFNYRAVLTHLLTLFD